MGCLVWRDVLYGVVFVFCGMCVFALRVLFGGMFCSAVMFVSLCCCLSVTLLGCIFVWLYCCFGLVVMLSDGNLVGRECDWSGFVVGWECGLVGMWSWDGNVFDGENVFCMGCVWGSMVLWTCIFTRMLVRFLNGSVFDDVL